MALTSSGTERNTARRMAFSVSSRNHRSTRLSHELDVGVKCKWNLGCLASVGTPRKPATPCFESHKCSGDRALHTEPDRPPF